MNSPDTTRSSTGCSWPVLIFITLLVMTVLSVTLWRRLNGVDPIQRCADAYGSSYTAIDTTLVDRIRVRVPNGEGKTTCGQLRKSGAVRLAPRRSLQRKLTPQ
jgi:hypothetical protein